MIDATDALLASGTFRCLMRCLIEFGNYCNWNETDPEATQRVAASVVFVGKVTIPDQF